jgi:hypothetical protein
MAIDYVDLEHLQEICHLTCYPCLSNQKAKNKPPTVMPCQPNRLAILCSWLGIYNMRQHVCHSPSMSMTGGHFIFVWVY